MVKLEGSKALERSRDVPAAGHIRLPADTGLQFLRFLLAAIASAAHWLCRLSCGRGLGWGRAIALLMIMTAAFLIGARLWNAAANPGNYSG
jgi:hypothetical protein